MVELIVRLDEEGADAARLDELTRALREELLGLDVDRVDRVKSSEPLPEGARAVDPATLNALLVATPAAVTMLKAVADVVATWVGRQGNRTAEVSVGDRRLTISGASREQQDRVIELFAREMATGGHA